MNKKTKHWKLFETFIPSSPLGWIMNEAMLCEESVIHIFSISLSLSQRFSSVVVVVRWEFSVSLKTNRKFTFFGVESRPRRRWWRKKRELCAVSLERPSTFKWVISTRERSDSLLSHRVLCVIHAGTLCNVYPWNFILKSPGSSKEGIQLDR